MSVQTKVYGREYWVLSLPYTLSMFVFRSGMAPSLEAAVGHVLAGRVVVGDAEKAGEQWILQRPFACKRITNPLYLIQVPCVIRGGRNQEKVAVITEVKS